MQTNSTLTKTFIEIQEFFKKNILNNITDLKMQVQKPTVDP